MKFWRMMAQYNAETTTYSEAAGTPASPYQPDFDGRLVGLRTIPIRGAATQLMNHVQWKLTCTKFTPNSIEVGGDGSGLQTAPAIQPNHEDWQVDQPINSGVGVTIEARNVTADTPVAVQMGLYGLFEINR